MNTNVNTFEKKQLQPARLAKERIKVVYKKIAPTYDLWARYMESEAREKCLNFAAIKHGESVLEVAVGTGLTFEQMLQENPNSFFTGIDMTEPMLAQAQAKAKKSGHRNYSLKKGDAYQLDFDDKTFDVLINNYMFDLIPEEDFPKILSEFRRVLKPGGRIVLVNMTLPERYIDRIWENIYRLQPEKIGGCRGVFMTPFLAEAGFQPLHREYLSQLTFPSEVVSGVKSPGVTEG